MIFPKKQLEWTLEVGFFLTFVIFVFHGATLGHVSGHMGTCHVDVQQMKKKNFENRIKIKGLIIIIIIIIIIIM